MEQRDLGNLMDIERRDAAIGRGFDEMDDATTRRAFTSQQDCQRIVTLIEQIREVVEARGATRLAVYLEVSVAPKFALKVHPIFYLGKRQVSLGSLREDEAVARVIESFGPSQAEIESESTRKFRELFPD